MCQVGGGGVVLLRSLLVWCGLVLAAIANAGVRETWISRNFGEPAGHALSTASLCAVILLVTWFSIRWLRPVRPRGAILIGTLWLALTIAFEFFAGHYAYGVRWSDLFADYNLARGRVFEIGRAHV